MHRHLRIVAAVASALVLSVTGVAWTLYRDVAGGITTTDVIAGGRVGGEQNILLVGVDSRTDTHGNPLPRAVLDQLHGGPDTGVRNSDTIIVLHVPAGGGAAVAFSIPRDSYVDIPGYRRDKINAAYPVTKALVARQLVEGGAQDRAEIDAASSAQGRSALVATVSDLTGLPIDHYAEINLLGFADLTSAIGGVDVCLNAAVDDDLSGAHLPAGRQTLAGPAALAFVRQRHGLPHGDLSRIRRQQVFLAAVAHKVLAAGTLTDPTTLSSLVGAVAQAVVIDSGWDLLAFAQRGADLAGGTVDFLTIPTDGQETNSSGDVLLVDRAQVHDFVTSRIAAQGAAADQTPPVPTGADLPMPFTVVTSRYVVDVRNGSARSGLAATVAAHLRGLGFLRGTVDNTATTATSVVRYTGSDSDAAAELAAHFGGIATEAVAAGSASGVTPGHLFVVLGADFDPRRAPAATAPPAAVPGAPITASGIPCVD